MERINELNEDDFDSRLDFFWNVFIKMYICFSDECNFYCNSNGNMSLNVWVGILVNHVIGPFFLKGNLNGEGYLNLLINQVL